jgi:flagellar motor component MotA
MWCVVVVCGSLVFATHFLWSRLALTPLGMYSSRSNFQTQKPENVLKRINELIASANGADREKRFALEQLHTIIASKRKHNWTKIDEALMKKHLELCVDLKDHRTAKDGLHQYRNLVQQVTTL